MSTNQLAGESAPAPGYWKCVDQSIKHDSSGFCVGYTRTYEHNLSNGILIRVHSTSNDGTAEAICFVPNPVFSIGPHR